MRSFRANKNLIAVSAAAKETAINTEQTLDLSLNCAKSDILDVTTRRENNADELTGKEEPDTIYDLGGSVAGPLTFSKCQPQHAAFIFAYGLGSISTAASGTGYLHTITPMSGDEDADTSVPNFTAAQRYGDTVLKRRFASCAVNDFTLSSEADGWCMLSANIVGTGKITDNVTQETLSALDNATSLTLAANGVEGSTAATRLDNMQEIKVELDSGEWTQVAYSAVSDATPAVITITDPGGAGASKSYKLLYIPDESGWMTFPSRVTETPLRMSQLTLVRGGTWDGSAFVGGKTLSSELRSISWNYSNNLAVEFTSGSGSDAYATRIYRPARTQTLSFGREFRDFIMKQHISDNDTFGVHVLFQGAEYESGKNYEIEVIFPKCGVLNAPPSVDGERLVETGDFQILEDDTYGSVIARVRNLQSAYCA